MVDVKNTEWFVSKARAVHGDLYDYSRSCYKNNKHPIVFCCLRCGKSIEMRPCDHTRANKPSGCRDCGNKIKAKIPRAKRGVCRQCGAPSKLNANRCMQCFENANTCPVCAKKTMKRGAKCCIECKPWWSWTKRALGKTKHAADQWIARHGTAWDSWATSKANQLILRSRLGTGRGKVKKLRLDWHSWSSDLSRFRTRETAWQKKARNWQRSLNLRERMQAAKNC